MKSEHLVCQCLSPEHSIRFLYNSEDKEIYTTIHLANNRPFWKRLVIAVKYLFGYECQYGHFDEFMMCNEDLVKIQKVIEETK